MRQEPETTIACLVAVAGATLPSFRMMLSVFLVFLSLSIFFILQLSASCAGLAWGELGLGEVCFFFFVFFFVLLFLSYIIVELN